MTTLKIYMPRRSSSRYGTMRDELPGLEPVDFGTDPDSYRKIIGNLYLFKRGRSYVVFNCPDGVTKADFRKYGMKAKEAGAGF